MLLRDLIALRQADLYERWLQAVFAHFDVAAWRRHPCDPFTNPVGHTLRSELPLLLRCAASDDEPGATASTSLEAILRVLSIQERAPSHTVAFVWLLRDVVRAELGDVAPRDGLADELCAFDRRVERLGLLAVDVYVRCREQIFQLRRQELERSVASILRRFESKRAEEDPEAPQERVEEPGAQPRATPKSLKVLSCGGER